MGGGLLGLGEVVCMSDRVPQKGLNTKRPTIVSFWVQRNFSHNTTTTRQACSCDTALVKGRDDR